MFEASVGAVLLTASVRCHLFLKAAADEDFPCTNTVLAEFHTGGVVLGSGPSITQQLLGDTIAT